jgi:hypothetical protein
MLQMLRRHPKKENVGMFLAAGLPRRGLEKSRAHNHRSEAANSWMLMSLLRFAMKEANILTDYPIENFDV